MSTVLPTNPDAAAYRELIDRCLLNAPDFSGVTEIADLPELDANDLALIQRVKSLTEVNTLADAQSALLEDVAAEWEIQNERRAEARDEDFYGSASPQTEQERMEVEYGVRSLFS